MCVYVCVYVCVCMCVCVFMCYVVWRCCVCLLGLYGIQLIVPDDIYNLYFKFAYEKTNARISSNSWGSSDSHYGILAQLTDKFCWDFKVKPNLWMLL